MPSKITKYLTNRGKKYWINTFTLYSTKCEKYCMLVIIQILNTGSTAKT